jgi:hypothetical protein
VKELRNQLDALTRAFLVRFFESEITTGTDDLKRSFFWLLAALAIPGMFIPWIMAFQWQLMAFIEGAEAVRIASRAEKTFYLGYSMIASGVITLIAWSSLLPDRRDTLILGTLPVRARTVVIAKIGALAAYVGLVAAGTHAVGAVFWGLVLGDAVGPIFSLRGIVAHFAASAAATMCVCFVFAAAQGLALTLVGPRLFRRASTFLQMLLVALIVICLAALPTLNTSIVQTLNSGPTAQPWILSMPPVWFLGLYEWVLGTSDPLLLDLARRATLLIAISIIAVVITYPLAYQRLMVSVVEAGNERRNPFIAAIHRLLVWSAGRHPAPQAAAEFFTATIARVDRQRFVLAITVGLAFAWALPGLRTTPSLEPSASLLSLPLAMMMFLIVGLRIAAALPSDVRAAWLFEVHHLSRTHARQALERTMFLIGVALPILLSAPVYWYLWGRTIAVTHALVMVASGVALVELLIWHSDSMPCGQRWTAARMDFGRRWPLHFAVFLVVVAGIPRIELLLFRNLYAAAIVIATLFVFALIIRYASAKHQIVPVYEDVDPVAGVLRLN